MEKGSLQPRVRIGSEGDWLGLISLDQTVYVTTQCHLPGTTGHGVSACVWHRRITVAWSTCEAGDEDAEDAGGSPGARPDSTGAGHWSPAEVCVCMCVCEPLLFPKSGLFP